MQNLEEKLVKNNYFQDFEIRKVLQKSLKKSIFSSVKDTPSTTKIVQNVFSDCMFFHPLNYSIPLLYSGDKSTLVDGS